MNFVVGRWIPSDGSENRLTGSILKRRCLFVLWNLRFAEFNFFSYKLTYQSLFVASPRTCCREEMEGCVMGFPHRTLRISIMVLELRAFTIIIAVAYGAIYASGGESWWWRTNEQSRWPYWQVGFDELDISECVNNAKLWNITNAKLVASYLLTRETLLGFYRARRVECTCSSQKAARDGDRLIYWHLLLGTHARHSSRLRGVWEGKSGEHSRIRLCWLPFDITRLHFS